MSEVWYFSEGNERVGPLDLEALKATLETYDNAGDLLVWRPGFAAWKRASDVAEVAIAAIRPPPLPMRDQSDGAATPWAGSDTESATLPTNRRPRFNNFVARNWRGECPLWVSYWIFVVLGTLILGATLFAIDVSVLTKADYAPHAAFAALTGGWLVILAVAVWQFVGLWRSASRRIQERRQLGKHTFWATLAQAAVVLGVVEFAVRFAVSGLPPIAQATRVTFMGDPAVPPYAIRVIRNATEAEITGGFKHGLTDDFRRILDASPKIKVLHLDSLGGRIGEARKLNALIRERGLITYVASRCASACVVAFAGGRERWLHTEGELGFHGSTVPGLSDADLADRADRQREIFMTAGFDPRFVDRALATSSSDLWTPAADELLAAKVITAISDGTQFAASGYGANLNRESMAAKLTENLPILRAARAPSERPWRTDRRVLRGLHGRADRGRDDHCGAPQAQRYRRRLPGARR